MRRQALVEWILPESEILEMDFGATETMLAETILADLRVYTAIFANFHAPEDYCSSKRPPPGAAAIHDHVFKGILLALYVEGEGMSTKDHIEALRAVSHTIYLSCLQTRELLGVFRQESDRLEVVVAFFNRVVDAHNEKVVRARFSSAEVQLTLASRLGPAAYFPYMQPEGAVFRLDFEHSDERVAAYMLVTLAAREGRENVRDCYNV